EITPVIAQYHNESINLHTEVLATPAHRWDVTIETIPLNNPRQRGAVEAWLDGLNGSANTFEWTLLKHGWPLGECSGHPICDAVAAGRKHISISGAPPNVDGWLRAGDFVKIASATKVYRVIGDVATDSAGKAAVRLSSPIVAAVFAGTPLVVRDVPFTLRMKPDSDMANWVKRVGSRCVSFSFEFIEAL
ncbi:MAG: hypothetical protein OIF34_02880, partial [Porticoccaceae bacterium]|nr:hypothetical protein [Porticoccaceae bacterium]